MGRRRIALAACALLACEPHAHPRPPAPVPRQATPSLEPPQPGPKAEGADRDGGPPPVPRERRSGAYADLDPDNDFVVAPPDPLPDCEDQLAKAGIQYARATLPIHDGGPPKKRMLCGAAQVVTYLKSPSEIGYSAPPLLTCAMALALASFEKILQEEAKRSFASRVTRIDHIGTYNCRYMPAYPNTVSEHSYANAIDIGRFVLAGGRTIEVVRDFDASRSDDPPPKTPAGRFLRAVSRRAHDEDVFSHVLTPYWDALHANHFHLDLARYRSDGTRPRL